MLITYQYTVYIIYVCSLSVIYDTYIYNYIYIYIIYIIYRNIPTKSDQYDATNECISVVQQVPKILCMPAVAIGAFWIFWYEWKLASACCLCPEILLMIKVFSQPVSTTGRTSSQPALANMQDHARMTSEWQVQQCSRIQNKDSICS